MPAYQTAILAAEIGSAMTRLTLVDLVDGEYRLVARAETPSTIAPPDADASQALLQLIRKIEAITGRDILRNGRPQIPATEQGVGVGSLTMTTSAASPLRVVIAALAAQQSARTAFQAARGSYASIRHVFAIDEAAADDDLWLSRQVRAIAEVKPDLILLAGGYEGSPTTAMARLGQVIGLVIRSLSTRPAVLYAGNAAAVDSVRSALGQEVELDVAPNLRPNATSSRLSPVRAAVAYQYLKRCLPGLPGFERLQKWRTSYAGAVADDQGVMVRFLAERFERDVLALDAGATHTVLQTQASGHYSQVVLTGLGTKGGSSDLVDTVGADSITRWLPFEITPTALSNRLLNRQLWPHLPPIDLDELLLDHALVREAIGAGLTAMRETRAALHYDMVVAGGVLARSPHPAYAALTLLDTLLSDEYRSHFAIDLYLDRFGLLATSGALARINPDAAVCLLERDGLSNGPLATVVLPHGDLVPGRLALQVELTPVGGEPEWIEVQGGSIARIALLRGRRGTLRIRPAGGVRIGPNAPGAEVLSDEAAIGGSALGVIVDARPRPLIMPPALAERAALLREWLDALGAPPPAQATSLPVAAEPTPELVGLVWPEAPDLTGVRSSPVAKIYDARPAEPAAAPPAREIHPAPHGDAAGAAPASGDEADESPRELIESAQVSPRRGFLRRRR